MKSLEQSARGRLLSAIEQLRRARVINVNRLVQVLRAYKLSSARLKNTT